MENIIKGIHKAALMVIGTVSLAIGIVGVLLPILPGLHS